MFLIVKVDFELNQRSRCSLFGDLSSKNSGFRISPINKILISSAFLFKDEVRTQKATKQRNTLEAVNNSVKLLNEMLAHFSPEDSTDADRELIRVCYLLDKTQMTFLNK